MNNENRTEDFLMFCKLQPGIWLFLQHSIMARKEVQNLPPGRGEECLHRDSLVSTNVSGYMHVE